MDIDGAVILIVEDEPLVALEAATLIKALGGKVEEIASSIDEARDAIEMAYFDCVMLDLNLSGDMAFEIAHKLRREGHPFFFCTASVHALPQVFEDVPRIGKPFNKEALAQCFTDAFSIPL